MYDPMQMLKIMILGLVLKTPIKPKSLGCKRLRYLKRSPVRIMKSRKKGGWTTWAKMAGLPTANCAQNP